MTTDGLLVVDKPAGWTSHDVVARVRRLCATRRVGHAGTLDPMATGVLVLGVNRGTRLLTHLVGCDKDYAATIRLGQATVTDDAEGEVTRAQGVDEAARRRLEDAVGALTGPILQRPSAVSAIKVDGKRSYARVRGGEQVELPPRPVTVSAFTIHAVRESAADGIPLLDVDVTVTVSSGTYVRALARDLGASLGTGGHLTALRRTRVGHLTVADAHRLEELVRRVDGGTDLPVVPLAAAAVAAFPVRRLTGQEATALGYGQQIPRHGEAREDVVAGLGPDGRLVALLDESGPRTRSAVVFTPGSS
ncbi:tRNA pseudouridine synthase B [Nostocoides japonicum T1-X7]|uniref:tRNA pseudouridine synthase B n=1 Tax=Nostocoides japonicum T1-X7 TaxID=1194083 RepID=A0A077M0Z8_9MICO|nr:tRNA pseudouridine(55) synthase TruB [Tetrasphaera japonica]CCH77864.1 tRNA pseudouridine synthase B [Tetrasphaera japonica T1-X7]